MLLTRLGNGAVLLIPSTSPRGIFSSPHPLPCTAPISPRVRHLLEEAASPQAQEGLRNEWGSSDSRTPTRSPALFQTLCWALASLHLPSSLAREQLRSPILQMERRSPWLEQLVVEPGLEARFPVSQTSVLTLSSSSPSSSSSHLIHCVLPAMPC